MFDAEFFGLLAVEVAGEYGDWLDAGVPGHAHVVFGVANHYGFFWLHALCFQDFVDHEGVRLGVGKVVDVINGYDLGEYIRNLEFGKEPALQDVGVPARGYGQFVLLGQALQKCLRTGHNGQAIHKRVAKEVLAVNSYGFV